MNEEQEKELCDMLYKYLQNAVDIDPQNLISHAADYFTRLRDEKYKNKVIVTEGSKENIATFLGSRAKRRSSVMGETYNPEEDDDDGDIKIIPKTEEERIRIIRECEDIFIFRNLEKTDLNAVINAMTPKTVSKGQVIIKQGDNGDFFYLIDTGIFNAYIKDEEGKDKLVKTYDNEGYFGELALLHKQPRAATVKAASAGFLWAVSRKVFNKLIVKRAFEKRLLYMELLDGVPQLKPLTKYEKMQVADALTGKSYSTDEIIFKEGDKGDGLYFIVEGKVSVRQKKVTGDGVQDEEIVQLGKRYYFGGKV